MSNPITTADGERIQTADDLAVAALQSLSCYVGNSDDDGEHLHMLDLTDQECRAILAAIRAGKVPGICASPDIAIAVAYDCAATAVAEVKDREIAALRADVERLTAALHDADVRGDSYMKGMDDARAEVERLRTDRDKCQRNEDEVGDRLEKAEQEIEQLKRELQKDYDSECCELVVRAEKAEARHAEAVALLREARHYPIKEVERYESATAEDLANRIDAHLAACDGKDKQ